MKNVVALFLFFSISMCVKIFPQNRHDAKVYQNAPITALLNGVMNDDFKVGEIKQHGNFGLGTFNGVDGEMIILNGIVYRVDFSGKVSIPKSSTETPFVTETFFHADTIFYLKKPLGLSDFDSIIDKVLPSKNIICAIKVEGMFDSVKTRSEEKQTAAYSSLAEILKDQSVFNFKDIEGTIAGFYFPSYMENINAAGYHFHFISKDKKHGGHVLNLKTGPVKIEIEFIKTFEMRMPATMDFYSKNFEKLKY